MEDEDPKAKSRSVSLLPQVWEKIDKLIENHEFDNRSDYIRGLVMDDFLRRAGGGARRSGSPDAMAPSVMVDLTRELLGRLDAEVIEHQLAQADQRHVLRNLLRSFIADLPQALLAAEGAQKTGAGAAHNPVLRDAELARQKLLAKTPPPKGG